MSNARYSAYLFFTLVVISIALPVFYYSSLPDQIASHFDFNNEADGWMNKESFLVLQISVTLLLAAMFFAISFFLPKFPDSAVNLPNKEFWLTGGRREESMRTMQNFFYWIGNLTLGFLIVTFQEINSVNLSGGDKISSNIWIYLIIFLVSISFVIIKMFLHFNRTDKSI
ncbi:MAG: DUF1648 domain-containing protein [Melioribacteraceae bacterium]